VGGTTNFWRGTEQIDRAAIEAAPSDKPIAFVPAANCPPEYGESFLQVYRQHGAPDGYVAPITSREASHDAQNLSLLRDAGLIYFGGGDTTELLASMTDTPAVDAVAEAYARGAVVVGMSAGAIALSERGLSLGAGVLEGWSWLERILVSVHHDAGRGAAFGGAMREHPDMLGIGIPEDAALALGPEGEIESWGDEELVVRRGEGSDG
jgi:cyanophycinase-like exopeptidase